MFAATIGLRSSPERIAISNPDVSLRCVSPEIIRKESELRRERVNLAVAELGYKLALLHESSDSLGDSVPEQ